MDIIEHGPGVFAAACNAQWYSGLVSHDAIIINCDLFAKCGQLLELVVPAESATVGIIYQAGGRYPTCKAGQR